MKDKTDLHNFDWDKLSNKLTSEAWKVHGLFKPEPTQTKEDKLNEKRFTR